MPQANRVDSEDNDDVNNCCRRLQHRGSCPGTFDDRRAAFFSVLYSSIINLWTVGSILDCVLLEGMRNLEITSVCSYPCVDTRLMVVPLENAKNPMSYTVGAD